MKIPIGLDVPTNNTNSSVGKGERSVSVGLPCMDDRNVFRGPQGRIAIYRSVAGMGAGAMQHLLHEALGRFCSPLRSKLPICGAAVRLVHASDPGVDRKGPRPLPCFRLRPSLMKTVFRNPRVDRHGPRTDMRP